MCALYSKSTWFKYNCLEFGVVVISVCFSLWNLQIFQCDWIRSGGQIRWGSKTWTSRTRSNFWCLLWCSSWYYNWLKSMSRLSLLLLDETEFLYIWCILSRRPCILKLLLDECFLLLFGRSLDTSQPYYTRFVLIFSDGQILSYSTIPFSWGLMWLDERVAKNKLSLLIYY